jgi:ATPase subunit of ABC transporter with duplicated ATPase domains
MFRNSILIDQDLEATLWLEKYLSTNERTLVLTSHDQTFLNNVVDSTIYIRQSKLRYFDGTPAALQVNEKKERRKMRAMSEALDKKREHVSLEFFLEIRRRGESIDFWDEAAGGAIYQTRDC